MKKHLFYTFLSIFIATAFVTLLGITKVVGIEDKYLTPLFGALLIELVGAVIAMYRGVNFFDVEKASPSKGIDLPGSDIESPIATFQEPPKKQPISRNQDQLLNLEDYFLKLESLGDRHREKSNLKNETHGRTVVFSGVVNDISDSRSGPIITCKSKSGKTVYINLPPYKEADAYSLRKGDFIKVRGLVGTELHSSTSISSDNFDRLQPDSSNQADAADAKSRAAD